MAGLPEPALVDHGFQLLDTRLQPLAVCLQTFPVVRDGVDCGSIPTAA